MSAGAHGHVAWVQHVHTDGSVTVAQYNGAGSRAFSTARVRAPRYLYVGVQAPR
jgi:surface antigen